MYVKGNDSMGTKILYQKVAADLKRRILDGDYEVGGLIPSEGELERYYQVSKITIRKAVEVLVSEGYLEKKSGIGTRVISNDLFNKLTQTQSFTATVGQQGKLTKELIKIERVPAAPALLPSESQGTMLRIKRRYLLDGKPFAVVDHYLPNTLVPTKLTALRHRSLYKILQENGQTITHFQDKFRAVTLADSERALLESQTPLAIRRERKGYDGHQRLVEFSIATYQTDVVPYQINYDVL